MRTDCQIGGVIWGLAVVCFASYSESGQSHVVEVGENASINCLDASHQANLSLLPNKRLRGGVVWRRKTEVDDKYWIDVDEDSSNITFRNVSVDSSGFYGCFYPNASEPLGITQLEVGYPPHAPYDVSCETNGYLTYLLCCWKAGRDTNLNTTYAVEYSTSRSASNLIQQQTTSQNRSHCELTRSTFERPICCSILLSPITETDLNSHGVLPMYVLQVNASNELGNAISLPSNEFPQMWVTPNPPRNVQITQHGQTTGHRSTSLRVQWNKPDVHRLIALVYKLRYRVSAHADSWHTIDDITETSYVITSLRSGSNYQVQVAAKPSGEMFSGFWSDWSNITSRDTDHNVPTSKFHFESMQGIISNTRSCVLQLQWLPYARTDEPGFHYKLIITYGGYSVNRSESYKTSFETHLELNLPFSEIRVKGQFCNKIGCSASDQRTLSVNPQWKPITNVKIQLDNVRESVSWDPPVNACGADTCIVQICASPRMGNAFNEIFGESKVRRVAKTSEKCENIATETMCGSGSISIFGYDVSPCNIYTAKVLRRCSTVASEEILIVSQPANRIYQDPALSKIRFELVDADANELNGVNITWKGNVRCSVGEKNLKLSAIYTPISGAECNFTECIRNTSIERIQNCVKSGHMISDSIYGGTEYNVGLGYCCDGAISSKPTLPFCFPASVTQRMTTSVQAPGVPLHFTWKAQATITLRWSPPRHKNGRLDGFIVSYGKTLQQKTPATSSHKTTATSYEIPNACSSGDSATYWVSVSAYNVGTDGKKLVGPGANISDVSCITGIATPSNMAAVFVGLAISLAVICCCLVACHYHRKRIKEAIRKSIWPPVPDPMLLISLRANASDETESPELPHVAKGDLSYDIARENSVEKVDNIYATAPTHSDAAHNSTRGRPRNRSAENHDCQCEEADQVHLLEGNRNHCSPSRRSLPHADSGLSSLQSSNPRHSSHNRSSTTGRHRHHSDSNLTEYSTISPMSPLLSLGSGNSIPEQFPGTSAACTSRPTSWTSMSDRISIPRTVRRAAMSCSDNSLSYVRYCQRDGMEHNHFSSPLHANEEWEGGNAPSIFYTKLAAVSQHSSVDMSEASGQARPSAASHDPVGSFHSLSDYVGGVDPYVTAPASNQHLNKDDITNNPGASNDPHSSFLSEGSQDSIDRLYTSVRQGANEANRIAKDAEEEAATPLLNEYVTMDQALEMGEESPSPADENLSVTAASNLAVAGDLDEFLGQVPNHFRDDASLADDDQRHNNLPSTSAPSELGYISVAEATQFGASTSQTTDTSPR